MKYLFFDMDGTLCKSRQNAESVMLNELRRLSKKKKVFIVSGAELSRMIIQVPLLHTTYFTQNGNVVYKRDKIVKQNKLNNKNEILAHINLLAKEFGYELSEDSIEDRGSQLVVSFTGFHAPQHIKDKFDPDRKIRFEMLRRFPYHNAYVAGLTGIDYIPKTKGENIQLYLESKNIKPVDCLYIGDALEKGANDHSVVGIIPTFEVKNPEDTLKFIKQL